MLGFTLIWPSTEPRTVTVTFGSLVELVRSLSEPLTLPIAACLSSQTATVYSLSPFLVSSCLMLSPLTWTSLISKASASFERMVSSCFFSSVAAFVEMIRDPVYREAVKHRQAAVADSRLIRLQPGEAGAGFGGGQ